MIFIFSDFTSDKKNEAKMNAEFGGELKIKGVICSQLNYY